MTASSRRRDARLILIILIVVAAVLLGAPVLWVQMLATRKWSQAEQRIDELLRAHPIVRPLVVTSEEQGANETERHFIAAVLDPHLRERRSVYSYPLLRGEWVDERVDEVLGEFRPATDHVLRAVRRCSADPSAFPPARRRYLDTVSIELLIDSGVLRARQARWAGDSAGAAEALLGSFHLARYWSESMSPAKGPTYVIELRYALEEFRDLLAVDSFSPSTLAGMERDLEVLERAWGWPLAGFEGDFGTWAEQLTRIDQEMSWAPYRWKILPRRLMKAEAILWADAHVGRLLACEGKPYAELRGEFSAIAEESRRSSNPIIQQREMFASALGTAGLRWTAQMRLLRLAAHYRATGEILDAPDPFGEKIRHDVRSGRLLLWSVGPDGVDNGGDRGVPGRWFSPGPAPGPPLPYTAAKDIVMDVPRRGPE